MKFPITFPHTDFVKRWCVRIDARLRSKKFAHTSEASFFCSLQCQTVLSRHAKIYVLANKSGF